MLKFVQGVMGIEVLDNNNRKIGEIAKSARNGAEFFLTAYGKDDSRGLSLNEMREIQAEIEKSHFYINRFIDSHEEFRQWYDWRELTCCFNSGKIAPDCVFDLDNNDEKEKEPHLEFLKNGKLVGRVTVGNLCEWATQ